MVAHEDGTVARVMKPYKGPLHFMTSSQTTSMVLLGRYEGNAHVIHGAVCWLASVLDDGSVRGILNKPCGVASA